MAFRNVRKQGTPWTKKDESNLAVQVERNTPIRIVASILGRTVHSIRAKAAKLGFSLQASSGATYRKKRASKKTKGRGTGSGGPRIR
jgi:hypothetical protein